MMNSMLIALSNRVKYSFISPTDGIFHLLLLLQQMLIRPLPWDEATIHEITFAQGGDILFLCHNTFMCQQIIRTGSE
jgi:hypothetical protein